MKDIQKKIGMKMMRNKQRGSFVLEALIAILLFAIGILAIIGLQAASIRNAAGAKYRTDASLLANQIIGQMWVTDKTNATLSSCFNGPGATSGVCPTAGTMDYTTWATAVASAVPGISGSANKPSVSINANNVATVTVYWQAPNENAPHNYSTVARIND